MIKGTCSSGFEFSIPESRMNDWETLEALHDIDDGDEGKIVTVAKRILDKKEYDALKETCRVEGIVRIDLMVESIHEIFEANEESKNS